MALAFLAAYSFDVLGRPDGVTRAAVTAVTIGSWVVFTVDYLVRLGLAPHRPRWFVRHLLDLLVVALPLLRPLRLLRLVVLVAALQKAFGTAVRGRVALYTAVASVLLVYVASLAVLDAERTAPDAVIRTFPEALWWSVTTVTTVGYGDYAPVTTTGRVVAGLLMVGGISLIGIVTGTLASWIVQRVAEEDRAGRAATSAEIDELREELVALRTALSITSPPITPSSTTPPRDAT